MRVGVGLVTCGREDYASQAEDRILDTLVEPGFVHSFHVERDPLPGEPGNLGVAKRKNRLLLRLLEEGCDWLFLSEDDILVDTHNAVLGYLAACWESGYHHLMFHAHGTHNPEPVSHKGRVTLWPNYVGAWSVYSRRALEQCGLFDERFYNAWEHVEHTLRLAQAGFTSPWRGAADATGSEAWLHEQPGAIDNSIIRTDPTWTQTMIEGREQWQRFHPETYKLVFG